MFNISTYLEKFKNFGQGEKRLKQAITSSVFEVLGLALVDEQIIVKNSEVLLKVSPAIKNSIFIKKNLILKKIEEKGLGEKVTDLR